MVGWCSMGTFNDPWMISMVKQLWFFSSGIGGWLHLVLREQRALASFSQSHQLVNWCDIIYKKPMYIIYIYSIIYYIYIGFLIFKFLAIWHCAKWSQFSPSQESARKYIQDGEGKDIALGVFPCNWASSVPRQANFFSPGRDPSYRIMCRNCRWLNRTIKQMWNSGHYWQITVGWWWSSCFFSSPPHRMFEELL